MKAVARAPAKAILLGEHFVVHGGSALAVALTKWVQATAVRSQKNEIISLNKGASSPLENADEFLQPAASCVLSMLENHRFNGVSITIDSEIPPGGGLGSSAATSVAVVAAVASLFGLETSKSQIYEYAMIGERMVHGRPSGIDVFVSVNGGLVKVKGKNREVLNCPPFWLMVSNSGEARNTGDMVKRISEYRENNPESFNTLLRTVDMIVEDTVMALQKGDVSFLAQGMNFSQEALRMVGASTEKIDQMVRRARSLGFKGAKLTGAGGGGCIIATSDGDVQKLFEEFRSEYPQSFLCSVPGEGVKTWVL